MKSPKFLSEAKDLAATIWGQIWFHLRRSARALTRLGLLFLVFLALAATLHWGWRAYDGVASGQELKVKLNEMRATLQTGRPLEIDRAVLGQVLQSAGAAQPALILADVSKEARTQTDLSGLVVRNAAREGRFSLDYGAGAIGSDRWRIVEGGQALLTKGAVLTFRRVDAAGFELAVTAGGGERVYAYDSRSGALAQADGGAFPDCAPAEGWKAFSDGLGLALKTRLSGVYYSVFDRAREELPVATLGGSLDCAEGERLHIRIEGFPWRMLRIVRRGEAFYLTPDRGGGRLIVSVLLRGPDGTSSGFGDISWPLDGVRRLIVRGVEYSVAADDRRAGTIAFTALEKAPLFAPPMSLACDKPDAPAPGQACIRWSRPLRVLKDLERDGASREIDGGQQLLRWIVTLTPLGLVLAPGLFFLARLLWRTVKRARSASDAVPIHWRPSLGAVAAIGLSTALSLLDPRLLRLDPMGATCLNWAFAGFVMLLRPGGLTMGLFWLAVSAMAMLGAINLAGMAADGGSDHWASHFIKHKLLFLDVLPPFAVALALAPARAVQMSVRGFTMGTDPVSRIARYGPTLGLLGLLVVWLLFGGERGLGAFQPVEAGKFATALLCASLVVALDGGGSGRSAWRIVLTLGLLAGFLTFLLAAPVLQSDFSPALIIMLLFTSIGGFYLTLRFAAYLYATLRRFRDRRRTPRIWTPVVWMPKTEGRIMTRVMGVVIVTGFVLWLGALPFLRWAGLQVVGLDEWPETVPQQIEALSANFGKGLRVPTERFIAYLDLDYDRPANEDGSRSAGFRDLEFQVIRSRAVIADALCGFRAPLQEAASGLPPAPLNEAERLAQMTLDVWGGFTRDTSFLCAPRAPPPAVDSPRPSRSLFEGEPISIPVVQFDFATSYLIGRFGLGAAALFYAAQAMTILITLVGIVRLAAFGSPHRSERTLRRFLAVLMAGSATLFILHWTISWCNILGLLPVMGQPMTWLSAATSHHLFMALPATLAIMLGLRYGVSDERRIEFRAPPRPPRLFFWE